MGTNDPDILDVFAAIRKGRVELVRASLAAGMSPETTVEDHWTLLHEAATHGRVSAIRLLLEHRANIDALDTAGRSPLFMATQSGAYTAVQVLIAADADVMATTIWGTTALHKAAMQGEAEIAQILIEAGATAHLATANDGGTPLHMAVRDPRDCEAESDRAGVGHLLIARGASVDARNSFRQTPLHLAGRDGDDLMAQLLLRAGANPNAIEEYGRTPLHLTPIRGAVGVTRVLLHHGAKVEVRDCFGETPLHRAAGAARATMVRLLLAAKANLFARSDAGLLPAEVLKQRIEGSDSDAPTKYGWRATRALPKPAIRATLRALERL